MNPHLLLNCLDVEPAENNTLTNAATDPCDGLIQIQTFSWTAFATQITAGLVGNFQWQISVGNFQWQISVSVTLLKSLFFINIMTNQTKRQEII